MYDILYKNLQGLGIAHICVTASWIHNHLNIVHVIGVYWDIRARAEEDARRTSATKGLISSRASSGTRVFEMTKHGELGLLYDIRR